jgi:zinc transport system ATP-binding protein
LLILDEPTAGVDAAGQEQFFSLLRHVREDLGVTVILVSHDIGLVLQEATNVACINRTLHCYRPADEITNSDLSHLYGSAVDLVIHRHE